MSLMQRLQARNGGKIFRAEHLNDPGLWDRMQARWVAESGGLISYDPIKSDLDDDEAALPRKPVMTKPKPAVDPVSLSVDEGAQYLGITADQVRAFIEDGELRYVNLGRGTKRPRIRLTKSDLDEFIERRTRREVSCLSTDRKSQHRITGSTSKSVASDFMARRVAQIAKKPRK